MTEVCREHREKKEDRVDTGNLNTGEFLPQKTEEYALCHAEDRALQEKIDHSRQALVAARQEAKPSARTRARSRPRGGAERGTRCRRRRPGRSCRCVR